MLKGNSREQGKVRMLTMKEKETGKGTLTGQQRLSKGKRIKRGTEESKSTQSETVTNRVVPE